MAFGFEEAEWHREEDEEITAAAIAFFRFVKVSKHSMRVKYLGKFNDTYRVYCHQCYTKVLTGEENRTTAFDVAEEHANQCGVTHSVNDNTAAADSDVA